VIPERARELYDLTILEVRRVLYDVSMPLKLLPAERVTLGGEIVALDEKGRSSFSCFKFTKAPSNAVVVSMIVIVFGLIL
jgi:hypothetical protein